jgi:hypothetical protein
MPTPFEEALGGALPAEKPADPFAAALADAAPQRAASQASVLQTFAKDYWKEVNPVALIKGIEHLVTKPIQSYQEDAMVRQSVMDQAAKDFKEGNFASAASRAMYALMPFMGSKLNEQADKLAAGNYAGAAGSMAGMATSMLAGKAIGEMPVASAAKTAAKGAYKSALGGTTEQAAVGVAHDLPISASGTGKLAAIFQKLEGQEKAIVGQPAKGTLAPAKVAGELDRVAAEQFGKQALPDADLAAFDAAKKQFLKNNPGPISMQDALDIKKGTYRNLPGKYEGGPKSAPVTAEQTIARVAKEELQSNFPEIKDVNFEQGKLADFQPQFQAAIKNAIEKKKGVGALIHGPAGTLATAVGVGIQSHNFYAGVLAGVLKEVIDNPAVKSRLAIAIYDAGKSRGMSMAQATAKVAAYANALELPEEPEAKPAP